MALIFIAALYFTFKGVCFEVAPVFNEQKLIENY